MRIFSFNDAHDSSVCSLVDGQLEFFCKEERLSRVKRDKFPLQSLNKFLELDFGQIDYCLFHSPTNDLFLENFYKNFFIKSAYRRFNKFENFASLTHHNCHAMLAYVNSGFEECLVVVVDRNGSVYYIDNDAVARESESIYKFDKNTFLEIVKKNFWVYPNHYYNNNFIQKSLKLFYNSNDIFACSSYGIVKVYEAATTLIGQNQLENGKTMGLASYGKLSDVDFFNEKNYANDHYFTHLNKSNGDTPVIFFDHESSIVDQISKTNFQFYADKAKQVQESTQVSVLKLIEEAVKSTNIKNVCVVGGYGLNVVANNFYVRSRPDINFYFEPVSDDSGITVGACFLKHRLITNQNPKPLKNTFYHYYDKTEKISDGYGICANLSVVVNKLLEGRSVGFFNGEPEAGPRALGNRSILFDARITNGKDIVNQIKKREWYRPFACIILQDEFDNYFYTEGLKKSESMTVNFFAKQHTKILVPSVIHVDNSCRVQTVNKSDGVLFHLLQKFFQQTKCPILLNTSLNLAGEPLVQTKSEALNVLKSSSLDYMYFCQEEKLVNKIELL